jgi:hypothetical protein
LGASKGVHEGVTLTASRSSGGYFDLGGRRVSEVEMNRNGGIGIIGVIVIVVVILWLVGAIHIGR